MRSEKDVEAYLLRSNRRFTTVDDPANKAGATFLVHTTADMPPVAVRVDQPLVVLRVHIGDTKENAGLFRRLLELNAKSLVHSSYGLEGERIVLSSALELENLDFNELQAALDEIDVALSQQVPMLAGLNKGDQK